MVNHKGILIGLFALALGFFHLQLNIILKLALLHTWVPGRHL